MKGGSKSKKEIDSILSILSKREISEFRIYLKCNGRKKTKQSNLFEVLVNPDSKKLDQDDFNKKQLSSIRKSLLTSLENYLASKYIQKENLTRQLLLSKIFIERQLFTLAEAKLYKMISHYHKGEVESPTQLLILYELSHLNYFSESQLKYEDGNNILQATCGFLNDHWKIRSLMYDIEFQNRNRIINKKKDHDSKFIKRDNHLISILKECYLLITKRQSDIFYSLLQKIKSFPKFGNEMNSFMILNLIQFALSKVQQGENKYVEDLLLLYQSALEYKVYEVNGVLPERRLMNIIDFGVFAEKFDWVYSIQANFLSGIPVKKRKQVDAFIQAQIYFGQEQYMKCLKILEQLNPYGIEQKIRFRWLKLAVLYECEFHDDFIKYHSACRAFSYRNKMMSMNLVNGFMRYLDIIMLLFEEKPVKKILHYFRDSQYIFNRKWLLSKLEKKEPYTY